MTDKLDVCLGDRKRDKAVSVNEKEINMTESELYTTLNSEALFIGSTFPFFFYKKSCVSN